MEDMRNQSFLDPIVASKVHLMNVVCNFVVVPMYVFVHINHFGYIIYW